MDRAELTPIGHVRRIQASRLGFVPVYRVQSTVLLRWDVITRHFAGALKPVEKVLPVLRNAVSNPGKELNVSRGEFDQVKDALRLLHQAWAAGLGAMAPALGERLGAWFTNSRRGYFRLVVLACVAALQHGSEQGGRSLLSKGLGGSIKKALRIASDGQTDAKAGSLYIALEAFDESGLVTGVKGDEHAIVSVTQAGMALLDKQLASITALFMAFDRIGILDRAAQDIVDAAVRLASDLGMTLPPVNDAGKVRARMRAMIKDVASRDAPVPTVGTGAGPGVDALHADWLANFNRGTVDLLVLGTVLAGPSYGNRIIKDAAGSLKFQAGTLYPRLADLVSAGLLEKIPPVTLKSLPDQGPERQFYDITPAGAIFFMLAWVTFLNDVRTLFTLLDEIRGPWYGKPHGTGGA